MRLAGVSTWVGVETRNSLMLSDVRGCYSFNFSFISLNVWLLDTVDVLLPLETLDEVLEGRRSSGDGFRSCSRVGWTCARSFMKLLYQMAEICLLIDRAFVIFLPG